MAGFPTLFLLSSLLCYGLVSPFAVVHKTDLMKGGPPLKIAAFNVQVFGLKKFSKEEVTKTLVKIIRRYDIIAIQEIRDSSQEAFPALLVEVNKGLPPDQSYQSIISERLGRTSSKEQYGFIYKPSRVTVSDSYHYDDGPEAVGAKNPQDAFQREPFIVRFSAPDTVVSDFAVVVIHTSPKDAVKEIDHLVDVYDDVVQKWGLEDVIITGDFNAGCSYVTKSEWADIRLRHDPRFTWLLGDDVDTTVAKSDCPYDRFVLAGEMMMKSNVPESAQAFRFDEAYGLSQDETEDVSDHYPIEMELHGKAKDDGETSDVESLLSITVSDPQAKISDLEEHFMILTEYFDGFKVNNLYTSKGDVALLSAIKTGLTSDSASNELQRMKEKLEFISGDMFDVARMQITPDDTNLTMEITCNVVKGGCEVTVSEKTL
ncbi:PREDICTED: deoxyribonuclease-1-like [Branchiostoma belcheri]|uniref:Deoxyribonuclease-1-like n=1 Tax=Branchiostoma belcheri TaxID=7741 RepID=A0A6P4Z1C0_BRABE|nr:PREDICTED: deoxyribonuclease-1-like [Branchiostoma belcheri]